MFSSKNKTEEKSNTSAIPSPNAFNTLAVGTVIDGNVSSASDIRVDGSIFGNLTCDSKVIIGPSGIIEGDVSCASAHIEGQALNIDSRNEYDGDPLFAGNENAYVKSCIDEGWVSSVAVMKSGRSSARGMA